MAKVINFYGAKTQNAARMLIAQASVEGATIVTHDRQFEDYDVRIVWT